MNVRFFEPVPVSVPRQKILSRLGHVRGKTHIAPEQQAAFERYLNQAVALIDLKGACTRLKIEKITAESVTLSPELTLSSRALSQLLIGCSEALLLGATAGAQIIQAIAEGSAGADVTGAVIFDAVAGEMTDAALDWMTQYLERELRREHKRLTSRRFSAGYGDLALSNQVLFYRALDLQKIGVTITDHYMLIPEKTVTAIAGIASLNG